MTKALRVASIGSSFRSNAVHWADQCALLKRPIRAQCPWNYTQKLCSVHGELHRCISLCCRRHPTCWVNLGGCVQSVDGSNS